MVTHLAPTHVVATALHTATAMVALLVEIVRHTATATLARLTATAQPMETVMAEPHVATALHTATATAQAVAQLAAPHLAR
jgi:hypothetical protein